jgi:hypothetical protein
MNTKEKQDLRTILNADRLRSFFPDGFYFDVEEVLTACPYTFNELQQKTRKKDFVHWRQILIAFKYASGSTFEQVGDYIGKDHSTCVYALKNVLNALQGFDWLLKEKIDQVVALSDVIIYATEDHSKNEILALRYLEHNYVEKFVNSTFRNSNKKGKKVIRCGV